MSYKKNEMKITNTAVENNSSSCYRTKVEKCCCLFWIAKEKILTHKQNWTDLVYHLEIHLQFKCKNEKLRKGGVRFTST